MLRVQIRILSAIFLVCAVAACAQKKDNRSGYDKSARATVLQIANVYIAADTNSQRVTTVTPGHEIVIIENSGEWMRVFANTDVEENSEEVPMFGAAEAVEPISGWIRSKGVVGAKTAGGDKLLFGAGNAMEDIADAPHPPKNASQAAHLLYRRVAEYFPDSPLAPDAAWRSADIRWQLEKQDISTLPSAREQESYLRPQILEDPMKKIIKYYPQTKWAALAAYDLLDNKLCGDWQGLPKCPQNEADLYLKYANTYPDGPKTAEALYYAAYRLAVASNMYDVDGNAKRSAAASTEAQQVALQLENKYPQTDYAARAATLIYKLQQGIAIYGADHD